jgi:hypothetical protein
MFADANLIDSNWVQTAIQGGALAILAYFFIATLPALLKDRDHTQQNQLDALLNVFEAQRKDSMERNVRWADTVKSLGDKIGSQCAYNPRLHRVPENGPHPHGP